MALVWQPVLEVFYCSPLHLCVKIESFVCFVSYADDTLIVHLQSDMSPYVSNQTSLYFSLSL